MVSLKMMSELLKIIINDELFMF